MLSAFTARPIIELKQRDKSKIETILAYGKCLAIRIDSHVTCSNADAALKVIEFSSA